jgi:arginyl-tRNA synthetase
MPQQQHLAMVFAASRMAGWAIRFGWITPGLDRCLVRTRKCSSRDLAGASASVSYWTRRSSGHANVDKESPSLDEHEHPAIAQIVGIGAVKYRSSPKTRSRTTSSTGIEAFDGNTAPYLHQPVSCRDLFRQAQT